MSVTTTQAELRLASLLDERDQTTRMHEEVLARIDKNENKMPDEIQRTQIEGYRERAETLDKEIADLSQAVESDRKAVEASKAIRRALAGSAEGVDVSEDGIVYRSMAAYARDVILTRESQTCSKIASQFGDPLAIQAAKERLQMIKRTPANTLSSNVGGLQPPQYIEQIFQVIDNSRPIVASAQRTSLNRGTLTYPQVTQRPLVAVQNSEKTEAGNQGMVVAMETTTASTYLGGGDLSWQAINWSTPDALQLWFDLAAASYALLTEQDAARTMTASALVYRIGTSLGATPTYAQLLTGVGAGAAAVYANSGRNADTLYMSPDYYWYVFGLSSDQFAQFAAVSDGGIGPLNIVVSRGMDAGTAIVGDSQALLVAETPDAPVELRVVEPAIGGVEVGLIGAFESVAVDPGAFALLTTAS